MKNLHPGLRGFLEEFNEWLPRMVRSKRYWGTVTLLAFLYSAAEHVSDSPAPVSDAGELLASGVVRLLGVGIVYAMPCALVVAWQLRWLRESGTDQGAGRSSP